MVHTLYFNITSDYRSGYSIYVIDKNNKNNKNNKNDVD